MRIEPLVEAIADAARLGYTQLAVSGGEPFMARSLGALLGAGRRAGMATAVTTNGTVLTGARISAVRADLDTVAVSVDGPPDDHNRIRRSPTAFARMRRGLALLRDQGVAFCLIFTLTRFNAHQLDWLASFAEDEGASSVQVHPLDRQGRAAQLLAGHEPDGIELLAAMAELQRLQMCHPRLGLHVDAATRQQLIAHRSVIVPSLDAPLVQLSPTLVIDDAGTVMPLSTGLDRSLRIGSLEHGRLIDLEAAWRLEHSERLVSLLAETYERAIAPDAEPATYWYDVLAATTPPDGPESAVRITPMPARRTLES
jgi:MoaA/NifB/PqqE/SkfB family radical SAM enzyme